MDRERARGGPVSTDTVLVGEHGCTLYLPPDAGWVIPADVVRRLQAADPDLTDGEAE